MSSLGFETRVGYLIDIVEECIMYVPLVPHIANFLIASIAGWPFKMMAQCCHLPANSPSIGTFKFADNYRFPPGFLPFKMMAQCCHLPANSPSIGLESNPCYMCRSAFQYHCAFLYYCGLQSERYREY